eukprot:scaffold11090_cov40-Phaeocystis_antarctica.AAC.2
MRAAAEAIARAVSTVFSLVAQKTSTSLPPTPSSKQSAATPSQSSLSAATRLHSRSPPTDACDGTPPLTAPTPAPAYPPAPTSPPCLADEEAGVEPPRQLAQVGQRGGHGHQLDRHEPPLAGGGRPGRRRAATAATATVARRGLRMSVAARGYTPAQHTQLSEEQLEQVATPLLG